MLRLWRHGDLGRKRPVLWYYRRSTSIRHSDGVRTEHGDGFMLSFCEPEELDQSDIACAAVADGLDILVVADERRLSGSLLIGLRKGKYTCEPLDA